MCKLTAYHSQLFTEYGRLAMDEIFLKPFQVRGKMSLLVHDLRRPSAVAAPVDDFIFRTLAFSLAVFNVPYSGLELSI